MVNLLLRESIYIYNIQYIYTYRERENIWGGAFLSKLKMVGPPFPWSLHHWWSLVVPSRAVPQKDSTSWACSCGAMGPWGRPMSYSGWWFQTWLLFSIIYHIYIWIASFPLTNSYFSRWLKPPTSIIEKPEPQNISAL